MAIALYPRATEPGKIRVWVGVSRATTPPELRWKISSATPPLAMADQPLAIARMAAVRTGDLAEGDEPRAFSGIYEFKNLVPGNRYVIEVQAGREVAEPLIVRSLPAQLPVGPDETFNILLVSCFHYFEASPQPLANVVSDVIKDFKASGGLHLSMLMGDQVYLDLPTLQNFRTDRLWLGRKFEQDYRRNWFGDSSGPGDTEGRTTYPEILKAAPTVFLPDDHEYWNNFPHASPFIENSWQFEDRVAWATAARALFRGFQAHDPDSFAPGHPSQGNPVRIDLPPVSMLIADSRTYRALDFQNRDALQAEQFANAFHPNAVKALAQWSSEVKANGWFGIFGTGQSLLSAAEGDFKRHIADANLSNYRDYEAVMKSLTNLGRTALFLTGDVHWGRWATLARGDYIAAHEIITSPSALVTTVGSDALKKIWSGLGSIFGKDDPWPRHGEGDALEEYRAPDGTSFRCRTKHQQVGDQVAVLSLQAGGPDRTWVRAKLRYYPVHPDEKVRREYAFPRKHEDQWFELRPPE